MLNIMDFFIATKILNKKAAKQLYSYLTAFITIEVILKN